MWVRLCGAMVVGTLCLLGGCGQRTPGFTAGKFHQSKATTEKELVADLGAGQEVTDSFTRSVAESHNLPKGARFLRWSDPGHPGVNYHAVIVDGRIVERDIWDSRRK